MSDDAMDTTIDTADDALLENLRAQARAPLTVVVDSGSATSTGLVRSRNEDAHGEHPHSLYVVADGMGGHPGGELAARTAVSALLSAVQGPVEDWVDTIHRLNEQVRIASRARGFDRAGTALIAATVHAGLLTIAHVGDARAYRRRGFELQRLTRDHSVREDLISSGIDVATLASRGLSLHALTRHVGGDDDAAIADVTSLAPLIGDRLLLCTDGVHRQLTDDVIVDALCAPTCTAAAEMLIELADDAGGRDNATASVVEFGEQRRPMRKNE